MLLYCIYNWYLLLQDETRQVVLYRYMTWPEDNIPENVQTFVKFMLEASKANESDDHIMLVHCR